MTMESSEGTPPPPDVGVFFCQDPLNLMDFLLAEGLAKLHVAGSILTCSGIPPAYGRSFVLPRNSSSIHCFMASRLCGRPRKPWTSSVPGFDPPGSRTALR